MLLGCGIVSDVSQERFRSCLPPFPFPGGATTELAIGLKWKAGVLARIVLRHCDDIKQSERYRNGDR